MQQYNLKDLYIAELQLSTNSIPKEEDIQKYKELIDKGAIDFQHHMNLNLKIGHNGILTIVWNDNNSYVSLHNEKEYTNIGLDYYTKITPIKNILPKYACSQKEFINKKEALSLFNKLFKEDKNYLYKRQKMDIDNFYLGNLFLCEGIYPETKKEKYQHINIPEKYILLTNQTKLIGKFNISTLENETNKRLHKFYDYSLYKCLYIKENNNTFYNIEDYQRYEEKNKEEAEQSFNNGESFCNKLIPIKEVMPKQKWIQIDTITIPKLIKVKKKILKKNI